MLTPVKHRIVYRNVLLLFVIVRYIYETFHKITFTTTEPKRDKRKDMIYVF